MHGEGVCTQIRHCHGPAGPRLDTQPRLLAADKTTSRDETTEKSIVRNRSVTLYSEKYSGTPASVYLIFVTTFTRKASVL